MLAPRERPLQFCTLRRGVEGRGKFPDLVRQGKSCSPASRLHAGPPPGMPRKGRENPHLAPRGGKQILLASPV
eukprot:4652493-Heterocapsa_arctica.AAC.1